MLDFYIYFISDPRTPSYITKDGQYCLSHIPFYVGKGTKKRVKSAKNTRTMQRINEIKQAGLEPHYVVLGLCLTEDQTYSTEEYFVDLIGRIEENGPLLNKIRGGNQFNRYAGYSPWNKGIPHSKETRKKLSERAKNRKCLWWSGKSHSDETKEKIKTTHWSRGPNAADIKQRLSLAAKQQHGSKKCA